MIIFPLIFLCSFIIAIREIIKGNTQGFLLFIIFGLSMYTTAMSVAFTLGLKDIIPAFQFFKELIILSVLTINILSLRKRPRFHLIDYLIFIFFAYTLAYAILPIGEQSFFDRLIAFKSTSFFVMVYFAGRFFDPTKIYINKYFNYIMLLTIAAGAVICLEVAFNQHLQTVTGYADYSYYFFNFEPSGNYGLSWTFESEGGFKRFASFFANPLENAAATLIALAVIAALYTRDDNKFKPDLTGLLALGASFICIVFAISRAPFASYFLVIYIYALLTKKKYITHTIHLALAAVALYFIWVITSFEDKANGIAEVIVNTLNFSNPSSVGHVVEWIEGVTSMLSSPFGLGLGTSGRVGGSLGETTGGENQFIIIGVQAGVLALLCYLAIYISFIRTATRWLPKLKGRERKVCMMVLLVKVAIFIPLLTSEVESSSYISYMNWFFSGLLISMIMQYSKNKEASYVH
ncbi:hypothetical protein [Pedobacter sp. L105]|uniref:hypothetical protein n=1 Tax=Pedobacter sp. L105 TaxID=1641871 RepID=UPI00131C8EC6|nr:hypothetical protein [Pedobacter sp. L105]